MVSGPAAFQGLIRLGTRRLSAGVTDSSALCVQSVGAVDVAHVAVDLVQNVTLPCWKMYMLVVFREDVL